MNNKNNNMQKRYKERTEERTANVMVNQKSLNKQQLYAKLTGSRIPKSLMGNSPFPPFEVVNLSYDEPTLVLNAASSFIVREFRLNSAYDFDPLLGGGTMSGYNAMVARYSTYHVEGTKIKYTVVSNEPALPVTFGIIYRDTQPSTTITSYALAQSALAQAPTSGYQMVGQTTGMSVYRSPTYRLSPSDVIGKPLTYNSEQGYDGQAGSNPLQLIWCAIIVLGITSATNLTNGIILSLNAKLRTRFYSLNNTL